MIYIGTLSFTFATNLVLSVWGFNTRNLCNVAIHVCISFYVFCKFLGYLYLVERMHQLSAGVKRRKDVVYLISMAIVLCGIGLFTGFAFVFPITNLSEIDGVCRIGLPAKITIPLLAYDVILNLGLAGIFFRRGTKIARVVGFQHFSKCVKLAMPWRTMPDPRTNPVQFTEYFMGRSLIAAFAIICPTITNLVVLFVLNGHEQGWLCFTICTVDSKSPIIPNNPTRY